MILPFMSFAWSPYSGKYGQRFVQMFCDVRNAAAYAAVQLKALPQGRRMLFFQNAESVGKLYQHPGDRLQGRYQSLWLDQGIAATKATFAPIIDQLWAARAGIDFVVFDIETGVSCWTLGEDDLAAIHADPRYAQLVATGRFPADCRNMNEANKMLFNFGCAYIQDAAVRAALITPLYKHYNNINYCNYLDAPCSKADAPLVPDLNGHAAYYAPSSAPYYSPSLYGYVHQLAINDRRFYEPFYVLAWSYNQVVSIYRIKATAKVMPWVAPKIMSNVLDWPWWTELIFHTCCLCGPNLLYFNADDPTPLSNWRYDNAVSQYVGRARGKVWKGCLTNGMTRYDNATFVCSAALLADGSVVGRVTFKPGVDRASVTVSGKTYNVTRTDGSLGAWFHS